MSKRLKRFTRKEKIKLGKRLGMDLRGKSNAEIGRILEDHDEKMPRIARWIEDLECAVSTGCGTGAGMLGHG